MTLDFNYDAGHGWLTSNTTQLMELGIYDKVSRYSYINTAYANEDGSYNLTGTKIFITCPYDPFFQWVL